MTSLSTDFTDKLFADYEANAKYSAIENAVTHNGLLKSIETRQSEVENDHVFSIDLTKDAVSNQKASGRCWMFAALNTFRHKMIASFQFEVNNERKAKFTYGTVPYTDWDTFIVTDGDKGKALNTFDEAKGKKIYVTTGTNQAAMAENYLKEHKDAFTLVYGEYTNEQIVEAIKSGTVDATLAPKYSNDLFIKNYGVNFVIGNQPVNQSKAFILFNKKADAKLQKAVNDEMEKLKSDGTLLKLSKKYLGGDYVPKN